MKGLVLAGSGLKDTGQQQEFWKLVSLPPSAGRSLKLGAMYQFVCILFVVVSLCNKRWINMPLRFE